MKINVKRIPVEGERLVGTESAAILDVTGDDVEFHTEIRYELLAQVQGQALLVTGRLATVASGRCSRCLRPVEWPLEVRQFVYHRELRGEDFVDLTENIREDILLELPQRILCDENCRGLCPDCGKDLNEGPCHCAPRRGDLRWQALDGIKID